MAGALRTRGTSASHHAGVLCAAVEAGAEARAEADAYIAALLHVLTKWRAYGSTSVGFHRPVELLSDPW